MTPSLITGVVRWYARQLPDEEQSIADHLAQDFVFDDGLERIPREDFLRVLSVRGVIEGLTICDVITAPAGGAVLFEGTDSVTGLFHRHCWLLVLDGQRIQRISSCVQMLLKPDERPWR